MKKVLIIAAACVVAFIAIAYAIDAQKQRDLDNRLAWSEIQAQQDAVSARIDQQLLADRVKFVRLRFGQVAASTFELCETVPPTTAEHKRQCKDLEAKVDRAEKSTPKW